MLFQKKKSIHFDKKIGTFKKTWAFFFFRITFLLSVAFFFFLLILINTIYVSFPVAHKKKSTDTGIYKPSGGGMNSSMSHKIIIIKKNKQTWWKVCSFRSQEWSWGLASWLPNCLSFFSLSIFFLCPWRRDRRWWRHQKRAGSHRGPYLSSCGRRKFRSSVKIDARYELTAVRPAFNYTAAKALSAAHRIQRRLNTEWMGFIWRCLLHSGGWLGEDERTKTKLNQPKWPKPNVSLVPLWGAMWLLVAFPLQICGGRKY